MLYRLCILSAQNVHIRFQFDSVTAVSYIQGMDGMTSSDMNTSATNIWHWCLQRNIFVSGVHIAGVDIVTADYIIFIVYSIVTAAITYSIHFSDSNKWRFW